jgi:hypothetical protein
MSLGYMAALLNNDGGISNIVMARCCQLPKLLLGRCVQLERGRRKHPTIMTHVK